MNTSFRLALSAALLALGASAAWAQSTKPGLWEIQHKMGGNPEMDKAMAEMQKQLAAMPPEQRKMMQDMMAKQGVQMGAGGAGGMRIKMCLTQEMVDRHAVAPQQQGNCTHTTSPRVGGTMKYSFQCTQPVSSGQGEVTFTSPEA